MFGIKKGMTRSEVENILGHSNTIKELGLQGSMKTTMYGEIGINYFEDKVAEIRLVPDEEITAEMMKQYYGNQHLIHISHAKNLINIHHLITSIICMNIIHIRMVL